MIEMNISRSRPLQALNCHFSLSPPPSLPPLTSCISCPGNAGCSDAKPSQQVDSYGQHPRRQALMVPMNVYVRTEHPSLPLMGKRVILVDGKGQYNSESVGLDVDDAHCITAALVGD